MKSSVWLKTTVPSFLVALALVCFGRLPGAQAVVPAPDGGYPGGNTAEGQAALLSLTSGGYNTAVGFFSLRSDTAGSFNTAVGAGTLLANMGNPGATEGIENTATGAGALLSNTTGSENTANGAFALFSNVNASANTATGFQALFSDTTGDGNTANGAFALSTNTEGVDNTAIGRDALGNNTTGDSNTAIGAVALLSNTTGGENTAVGQLALSNTTGDGNIAVGFQAGALVTTANNVIAIGHPGLNVDDSCFIGNIRDAVVAPNAAPVLIDATGKLGTTNGSSRRFKQEIKPMNDASESILALKPVTFNYKNDAKRTPQFGLIAEEVAEIDPDLIVRDKNGDLLTVRYDAVNTMLLNEFLKEHRRVQDQGAAITTLDSKIKRQEAIIARQKTEIRTVMARLNEQAVQIQEISAQVELNKRGMKLATASR
jgi:hypothetical protein